MITQADSRKWMARLYNSFLFMEAKIMKMAKKLLAVVLAGVMAVSMLTGCALGDAVSEKELLDKMNTFGAADNVKYAVEKKDGDFDLADAREKAVKAVKELADEKDPANETITVTGAVVCVVEVPSSGSNKWSKAAKTVNTKMVASANQTGTGTAPGLPRGAGLGDILGNRAHGRVKLRQCQAESVGHRGLPALSLRKS